MDVNKDIHAAGKFQRLGGDAAVGRVVSYTRSNGPKNFAIALSNNGTPSNDSISLMPLNGCVNSRKQIKQ